MRVHRHLRQARAKAIAVTAFCLIATMMVPVASAQPDLDEASNCGSVGSAVDDIGEGSAPTGPIDDSAPSTNGPVGQVSETSTYDDSALNVLDEHTELLRQSDSADPAIVKGRLESDCGVAFVLDGTQRNVGPVGITGLNINENSRWLVQGLEGSRGYRVMAVLENAQASKSYTVELDLDQNISVVSLDNGGAVFVNDDDLVIGSILAPWALDGNGQPVPITQSVTTTGITITVDTSSVVAWPVIADPTYHTFRCYSQHQVTTTATASQYLKGQKCPRYADIIARGYYPQWIEHFNRWRVGKANGDCTLLEPDRLNIWGVGVVYDFRQACKAHDYCYDLGHPGRLGYINVTRSSCDSIIHSDMRYDCSNRSMHVQLRCYATASFAYLAIRACTWCW